ncbi:5-formyltetrahydrofolate cyclo-ligase [Cytobacillus eiseniae]|uniref:5-formyltetrahydrofolate cyclo-ligase n=1 Tax=Cytobacillus eiseniae TaxID=762947 RepID=A0ABS4RKE1_9BACI|nr:5-formyltetrahydrofolate cyclo-ligase [Cytobacillus eiseniae]MBP2243370.1 5-formyltetrahydrofolate cyclo-ligase [Cytobacillus eiseniae]
MTSEKKELRKQIMESLGKIEKTVYEQDSYEIAESLYQDVKWKSAKTIGITISKFPEVDTYQIIRKAWEEGKRVAVPKCLPKEKSMVFRTLTRFDQLESVYYGLLEPKVECTEEVQANEIDLLIVPGLAYTIDGYRVGFGGGYYDRYLTKYDGYTVSLAFQSQLVSHLPIEDHDLAVKKVISTNKIESLDE